MTTTTTTITSGRQTPSIGSQIFDGVYEVGVSTAAGALAGYMFSIINPVGGAIFGASMAVTRQIAFALADKFCMDQTAVKIAAWAISLIASVAVGIFAATTAGFPLTVLGSIGMILTMLVTSIATRIVVHGAACFSSCLGGAGLAIRERC